MVFSRLRLITLLEQISVADKRWVMSTHVPLINSFSSRALTKGDYPFGGYLSAMMAAPRAINTVLSHTRFSRTRTRVCVCTAPVDHRLRNEPRSRLCDRHNNASLHGIKSD